MLARYISSLSALHHSRPSGRPSTVRSDSDRAPGSRHRPTGFTEGTGQEGQPCGEARDATPDGSSPVLGVSHHLRGGRGSGGSGGSRQPQTRAWMNGACVLHLMHTSLSMRPDHQSSTLHPNADSRIRPPADSGIHPPPRNNSITHREVGREVQGEQPGACLGGGPLVALLCRLLRRQRQRWSRAGQAGHDPTSGKRIQVDGPAGSMSRQARRQASHPR